MIWCSFCSSKGEGFVWAAARDLKMELPADGQLAATSTVVLGCGAFVVWWILAVFPAHPWLPVGRTAGSLVGAMLMVVFQVISPTEAYAAVDLPILGLLFGTMLIGVYLERANLFIYLAKVLSWKSFGGKDLLCRVCVLAALCSAFFTNDTTCVVFTGFVLRLCKEKRLPTLPFVLALATSSNIGSAATAIGNPQNLVIAVESNIGFGKFLLGMLPAVVVGIVVNTGMLLVCFWRSISVKPLPAALADIENIDDDGNLSRRHSAPADPPGLSPESCRRSNARNESQSTGMAGASAMEGGANEEIDHERGWNHVDGNHHVDGREVQCASGDSAPAPENPASRRLRLLTEWKPRMWIAAVYLITLGFLAALLAGLNLSWSAITAALALVILDFRDAAPSLDKVSYSLLVFFSGMFIAVEGFNLTGIPGDFWHAVEPESHINNVKGIIVLSLVVILLSNVASNVPTVLLLGARVAATASASGASVTKAWLILAWVSTVAGNFTLLGSAANLIVSEQARTNEPSFNFTFWNHLPFGIPSTLIVVAVGLPLIRG